MIRDIGEGSSYEKFVSGVTTFINNENVKLENDDDGLLLTNIRRYCEEAFKQK
jgi:hypothetical protein